MVVDFAGRLADKKGMTFYFYRSHINADGQRVYKNAAGQEVPAGNGYYDPRDGSIHIDLNAGDEGSAMLSTIAHELTHFIQDWSPAKYRTFCRILMEGYTVRGNSVREMVLAKQDKYRQELGIELTNEEAYDEVIASSMESVLNDGNVMDLLDTIETRDKSLWEQIRSFLEEVAALMLRTVQAFRGVHPESPEGRIVERMTKIHAQLQLAFAEGLHEGGENYRTGGQKNTAQTGGVKYAYNKPAYERWEVDTALLDAMDHMDEGYDNLIRVGNMPRFVVDLLGIEGDFYIYRDHAYENMSSQGAAQQDKRKTERKGKKVHFHSIGIEKMAEAIMALEHPIMTIEDGTAYGNPEIVMVLPVVGQNEAPLYAALSFYSNNHINGKFDKKPHVVLTVSERNLYADGGRDGYVEVINKAIEEGRLISYDKEKMSTYLSVIANHTRVGNVTSSMLNKNLSQVRQKVKNFKERNKIKYSARYQQNEAAQHLQQENDRMTEDVAALTPLVQALRKVNGGKMRTAYLAEAVAHLKKIAGAKGNSAELSALLSDFYSYVTQNDDYTWEDIRQKAKPPLQ